MRMFSKLAAVVLGVIAIGLIGGGGYLAALGGSLYYLLTGLAYLLGAALIWRGNPRGGWLIALVGVLTVPWALWEVGLDFWGLFPRLLAPFLIAAVALLLSWANQPRPRSPWAPAGALLFAALFAGGFDLAFVPHGVVRPDASVTYATSSQPAGGDPNWLAYGRTNAGDRFGPFDQINRTNVGKLETAWTYRTGDSGPGIDQNTPLQIDDLVYSCSRNGRIAALDADSGTVRWAYDSKAKSPFWQRCRGLGYHKDTAATGGACTQRLIYTSIDARMIALDARTGQLCDGFGEHGTVALSQGMGEVKPGFYFQTSAPLIARNLVIVGGWVVDNQMRGEPSGVIRAFDVHSGALVWAWDLANPAITRDPPPGGTYTRGTPNMWTTASFDDALGLVYLPLGNATPDYFGVGRPPNSDDYNASLVALDVATGRERWRFRTVNHDIWDYDLPSQPALIDIPDGKGGVTKAVLQTTKRGQLFLLDRTNGQPVADVAEKPAPQTGAVPEETLAKTQPYSVGMPTIGAERLTEQTSWGITMFDQLYCRIDFRRLRYDGDFTPIGLTPAIQQPGNTGGFNWGSVSIDAANSRVFMNDIRIPSVFYLVKRENYAEATRHLKSDGTGHGPSPQAGTPYGMVTGVWLSPLGIPCNQPPFGTITAVDLKTRKVAWQTPAGTAAPTGLALTMGMPTYAGTMTTAGGLVFFAGYQDFYLRAYDAETGKELWKHELPIGASATPMTYVSPATGRQYVVISVGGAAYSRHIGDYVIAFALPK
ncbi:membrane-bound PQQ-dependent dehydrogenase, glucose/quinate/shikimate family [Bradyrhizobium sp. U87765 SZCCT0131]|uniref:membrane-bound PQQ-dependent dehydrogenase, glucose/quinate/shikimate family n=1 Tax=unclassified Bradyrhizobium TaxID=2631580 RepID=UPI001BADDA12|nr:MULTISPECIES: membrane-bound PQQ-dependent dehydrogenase, glucose/quinate/shikimate family [unclassified Bradyrhizobium]MBR1222154.1 membrane-bound PQQ-dependent dehydrogenase, glucose/quinate/shikimate family [Bradyrhizobium sp. U87765 SZCCT0131]MBR1265717.1 membrane-bound PQQ-dependent dehydrogenase, glucose/quinate/shikimate family [Bradyrhizobium sp. U87765 SZCCT0134]MBR1307855.1 membrane-bound PQQ-dependent dehydrogenase, glucose/quinate/shikimate family [Bradyrhizobium sp. U87765 SZCCT0